MPLPSRPNLEQLKKQAKDLLKSLRSGDAQAEHRFQANPPLPRSRPAAASYALGDAQFVIAREHGFATWARLKHHIESLRLAMANPMELLHRAFADNDALLVRDLLEQHPEIKARVNEPVGPFDSPAIIHVQSREMLDVLLQAGADINAKSRWWAGGFGLLHSCDPALAAYAIERGAVVDAHAAARLGLLDRLRALISADPSLVHARGGDGQTPLHFASTVETAAILLDGGANINAQDVDHESTPAQYMVRDRQEVARYLVQRGCQTDILMAAALGDAELVRKHLAADPACVRVRVNEEYFPKNHPRAGGTIYQWTLGWHVSAHDVARQFGHQEIARLLMEHSPAAVRLMAACWAGDENEVQRILSQDPGLELSATDRSQVAHAARNNNTAAVRTMLSAGLPVDALGQHGATPLHWAAFHGNAEMARIILQFNPPLLVTDADFQSSPLGWAVHGSEHGWYRQTGDYAATVEALLEAGAKPEKRITSGSQAVRDVLRRHGLEDHP